MSATTTVAELESLETLGQVIHWALARTPPAAFEDVIIQDEFTHDVIVRVEPALYAVFDTT